MSKPLAFAELAKDRTRCETFLQKIRTSSPFETMTGNQVILNHSNIPLFESIFQSGDISFDNAKKVFGSNVISLALDNSQEKINMNLLKKSSEFGGVEYSCCTFRESSARECLQGLIEKAMKTSQSDSIDIQIGNIVYPNIYTTCDQPKMSGIDPKCDFQLLGILSKPVFISHKYGTTALNFSQWSGICDKAGLEISQHPEVLQFVEAVKNCNQVENLAMKPKATVARRINCNKLKNQSVFGKDWNAFGDGSEDNVDIIAQGDFQLSKICGRLFELRDEKLIVRKEFQGDFEQGYNPILIARFSKDRSNHGIQNTRISVYPEAGRKVTEWI